MDNVFKTLTSCAIASLCWFYFQCNDINSGCLHTTLYKHYLP